MKFRDGGLGLDETITKMKVDATAAKADNLETKRDAMRAIGGNVEKVPNSDLVIRGNVCKFVTVAMAAMRIELWPRYKRSK